MPEALRDMKYGERDEERIDFLPAVSAEGKMALPPTLLWIHGGAWQIPAPKEVNAWVACSLRVAGVNVALLEYSSHSPNNLPISIQCQQAIAATRWLAAKFESGELCGDPNRFIIGGL